jgi:BolA family transcriptional regulator, general stress-responsive regulator
VSAQRLERMRALLSGNLHTDAIELIDDSHLHAGHAGAREGKGHFRARIVSRDFAGLRPLQRHQLVYRSLGDMMRTDIHALTITALTPDEEEPK